MRSAPLEGIERLFRTRTRLWSAALALLVLCEGIAFVHAVGGDWYRSGNDMRYILAGARTATGRDVASWLTGPWIGRELFLYYRPLTSLVMYLEYRAFGEHSAPWQILSLLLHLCTSVLLALLCQRIFRSYVAGLLGAGVWAFRDQMADVLEWTPTQADLLAGFLVVSALLTLKLYLDERRRYWLVVSIAAAVLALGAKEVALILPALVTALVLHASNTPRAIKVRLIVGAWLLICAFAAWRIHALSGLGFLPGQSVHHNTPPMRLTPGRLMNHALEFLLPSVLGPLAFVPFLATVVAGITVACLLLLGQGKSLWLSVVVALVGLVLVTCLMGGLEQWFMPSTYSGLFYGIVWLGLIAFAVWRRPKECGLILIWGLAAWLPLYHVVYNKTGYVYYVPDTYWALVCACLGAAATGPAPLAATPETR